MATSAQIIANQQNALLSTGPRSAEGQARASQNALRHGLTAQHIVVRDDEQEEFAGLRASLLAGINPQGVVEMSLFQQFLHAAWRIERCHRLEEETWTGTAEDLANPQIAATLDRISRYEARALNAYHRALKQLRVLQTDRVVLDLALDPEADGPMPVLADKKQVSKQSQALFLTECRAGQAIFDRPGRSSFLEAARRASQALPNEANAK